MFICNTICDREFTNHLILVDQMSHGISKGPRNLDLMGQLTHVAQIQGISILF